MAYLDGFEHDVFISYCSDNNSPLYPDKKSGWVDDFHKLLADALLQRMGRRKPLSVWYASEQVKSNHQLKVSVLSACRNSAVLVCIVSPSYLESDWCTDERKAFLDCRNRPADALFMVRLYKLDRDELPEPLNGIPGHEFYDDKPENKWSKLYCLRPFNDLDQRFTNRIAVVADEIAESIKKIEKHSASRSLAARDIAPPREPSDTSPGVFVAEGTDDVRYFRKALLESLQQFAVPSAPKEPLPRDFDSLKARLTELLKKSQLSVHLLGQYYGEPVAHDPQNRSVAHFQYDLARDLEVPRVVWIRPQARNEAELEDDQRQFLQSIRQEGATTRVEVLDRDDEDMKQYVLRRARPPQPAPVNEGDEPLVHVVVRSADLSRPELKQINLCCIAQNFRVNSKRVENEPIPGQMTEDQVLNTPQGVLIFYGSSDIDWYEQRVENAYEKKKAKERDKKLLVTAVLDGPPPPADKPDPEAIIARPGVDVISARDGINPAKLEPFFEKLRQRRAK